MSDDPTPEDVALAVMRSEAMLWLMNGSGHAEVQLASLRRLWDLYVRVGGETWGVATGSTE